MNRNILKYQNGCKLANKSQLKPWIRLNLAPVRPSESSHATTCQTPALLPKGLHFPHPSRFRVPKSRLAPPSSTTTDEQTTPTPPSPLLNNRRPREPHPKKDGRLFDSLLLFPFSFAVRRFQQNPKRQSGAFFARKRIDKPQP